jgi:glucosylglycerate phosphorylase
VLPERTTQRLHAHLVRLYGDDLARRTTPRLVTLLERFVREHPPTSDGRREPFDETDVVLISYGDQVRESDRPPLQTLRELLLQYVGSVIPGLHLLPHHPSTSDDGFAVSEFSVVDPMLGDWTDVERLADVSRLMLDAVVNHTSASHPWFVRWRCGDPEYADFYIGVDPDTDLRSVTRPRTTALLTPFWTREADRRWVWTTFSGDQVDLNYANPEVLLAMTAVLLEYVGHGARLLRLDAAGFLWKRVGTSCLHLPETHEIIRLWRTVVDSVAPGTLIVTETNVPHHENITYFGSGRDEAHLVYQFALPPLTLATFISGDAGRLTEWAGTLGTPSELATYLNFLASHDGVGLRPVEDILGAEEIAALCTAVTDQGGLISYRAGGAGVRRPYELNSVYLDALGRPGETQSVHVNRFLAAHSILLALAGVPAIYFQSLFGSRNWVEGAEHAGRPREVNRQRFSRRRLATELADPMSLRRVVLDRMLDRISTRTHSAEFHPNADQRVLSAGRDRFAMQRSALSVGTSILCVHDVSGRPGRFRAHAPDSLGGGTRLIDLCDGSEHIAEADGTVDVDLPAYGVRWLRAR